MAEFPTVETSERFYSYEGRVYLVRDVRVNKRVVRTEYATSRHRKGLDALELDWHPMEQGSRFDAIRPFSERNI